MFQDVFRSGDLPAGEGMAAADELFATSVLPMRLLSDRSGRSDQFDQSGRSGGAGWSGGPGGAEVGFEATVRHLDIAPVTVVELAVSPSAVLRTPKLIRRGDPEFLSIVFPMSGELTVSQSGRDAQVRHDELVLYDSSQPFRMSTAAERGVTTVVSVHTPRALLRLPLRGLDGLLARPLPARRGMGFGGMLSQLLTGAASDSAGFGPADRARLGHLAHDLMTAFVAHHLDIGAGVPDDSRERTLLLRVDSFIQRHLHDPYLSPGAIAAAHHISVTHLHRLFESRDTTVAALIRRQRLDGARRDLADPALRGEPVHRVAARWGFKNHSTFTRAFRAEYGVSPQEYRHEAARLAEPAAG